MLCLTSARFVMKADILRAEGTSSQDPDTGEWVSVQDPDTGTITRKWKPADNPQTSEDESGGTVESFPCEARGFTGNAVGSAGAKEEFGTLYDASDYVRITFPANVRISRRDRITNIRDAKGNVLWVEEERPDGDPTVFNVLGVTPVIAPLVGHVENVAVLERSEVQ